MRQNTHALQLVLIMSVAWSMGASVLWAEEASLEPGSIGLSVEPGGLLIQHVEPGETYDFAQKAGIALKISNRNRSERIYRLSTHRPSEIGNRKWLEGYTEIPDPSWFWFERDEVSVGPDGDAYVKMYVKVPEGDEYANQHWVVSIAVEGKAQSGEMLALAAYPRYQIETASSIESDSIPVGPLGMKPSILSFEGVPLGVRQSGSITLYNSDAASHQYSVSIKTVPVDPTREQIVASPGYDWIPEPKWITLGGSELTIDAGQRAAIEVNLVVADKAQFHGQKWEALLWIEPDEGLPRFARIQIETEPASSE